jgi:hypothetical protein
VFSAFWLTLANLYQCTPCDHQQLTLARCTKTFLAEIGQHTSKLAVCKEMNEFYQAVEEMQIAAQTHGHRKVLIRLLNVSIDVFLCLVKLTTIVSRTSSKPGSGPPRDQDEHSSRRICFIRPLCLLYISKALDEKLIVDQAENLGAVACEVMTCLADALAKFISSCGALYVRVSVLLWLVLARARSS